MELEVRQVWRLHGRPLVRVAKESGPEFEQFLRACLQWYRRDPAAALQTVAHLGGPVEVAEIDGRSLKIVTHHGPVRGGRAGDTEAAAARPP